MTTPDGPVEFEWSSNVATGGERTWSSDGGRRRLPVPALVVAVLLVGAAVVVSSTLRSDDEVAEFGLMANERLPLTVEPIWTQPVEAGIEAASVRVTDEAMVFIVADRGGSFRKVEALDRATGVSIWERRSGTDVVTRIVTVTESTYVVETSVEDDRRLVGYDLATGATAWEHRLDRFELVTSLGPVPLVVEVLGAPELSTLLRDADTGDVVVEFDAMYAGVDLAGMMRLVDAGTTVSTFDLVEFEAVRRDRGLALAATAAEPVIRGDLSSASGFAIVGGDLFSTTDDALEVSGDVVTVRELDGELVELAGITGVVPVGGDRMVIATFDGLGGSVLRGGVIRRGVIEIDWTFEGFIQPGSVDGKLGFVSDGGPRAVVVTPGARVARGASRLFDLVSGEVLVEFESPLRPDVLTAANGVVSSMTRSDDGFKTTAIAYDSEGAELWRIGPTENVLGTSIGDEFVVTLTRDADGEVVMTGYGA